MSNLRVTSLRGRTVGVSPTLPDGAVVTGVTTSTSFSGNVTGNISGGTVAGSTGTFTGDVDIADKIIHTGDTNTAIRFPAADTFTVETGGTERARVNSGGVLLGLTAAVGEGGTPADLNSTEIGRGFINLSRDDTAAADHILFGKNGSIAASMGTHTSNSLVFKTGTTERVRIDSSGRLGVGNNLTNAYDSTYNHLCIGDGTGNNGMLFHAATNGGSYIGFKDTSDGSVNGLLNYIHTGDYFELRTAGTTRARVDSDGLKFNADTAAANALDDYEEGSWTPTNNGATVNSGTFAATGSYTKIGNIVTVQFSQTGGNISWSAGAWLISGLPFAAAIFGSVGSATDTGPSFTSSVMIWTASQFYIQSAGSSITSLRITATYRV